MEPEKITKEEFKAADGKIENTEQFKAASGKLVEEREAEASAVDEFPDYEELDGVRFYAPSAKHKWALAAFAQTDNAVVNGMVGGYVLGTSPNELSRIFIEAKDGSLQSNALDFSSKFNLEELGALIGKLCTQGDFEGEDEEGDSKN